MRLETLSLTNWGVHHSLTVDLTRGLEISGRNGTGKSTILEAIRFMFQETGRGYSRFIKNGQRQADASLSFTYDNSNYLLEKTIYVDKSGKTSLIKNGVILADNSSSAYSQLQKILPEDIIEKLLYVRQGELTHILERLSGREGKTELDRLFGLDRLENVWKKTGDDQKTCEGKLSEIHDMLKKHPEDSEKKYASELHDLEFSEKNLRKNIKNLEESTINSKTQMDKLKQQLSEYQKKQSDHNSLKENISKLILDVQTSQVKLDGLEDKLKSNNEKKEKLNSLLKKLLEFENIQKANDLFMDYNSILEKLKDMGDLEQAISRKNEIQTKLMEKTKIEKQYVDQEITVNSLKDESTKLKTLIENHNRQLESLNTLNSGSNCPRCGQILDGIHIEKEKTRVTEEIQKLKNQLLNNSEKLVFEKGAFQENQTFLTKLVQLENEKQHLDKLILEKTGKKEELSKQRDLINKELSVLGFSLNESEKVKQKLTEFNQLTGKISQLEKDISEENKINSEISEITKFIVTAKEKKIDFENQISNINFEETQLEHFRIQVEEKTLAYFENNKNLETKKIEIESIQKTLNETRNKQKDFNDLKNRKNQTENELRLLKMARKIFHRDHGLVRYLRERFLTQLSSHLSTYFKRFNQNPKYLDVKFNQDYSLDFKTNQGLLGIHQLSGGEKAQISLALRLALIDLMSPIRLLILDEPFGSLDEEHREILGGALNKISESGQLVLVTHVSVDGLNLDNTLELTGY